MKFGILIHKNTMNIGDDIQTYATAQFVPSVDYLVDREELDTFKSEGNEPVALIMSAWYMWKKWNWPPSEDIYPLLVGFHHFERNVFYRSLPIMHEHLTGIGAEWFKAYEPIGCRDNATVNLMKKLGFEAYFSGCITLTLPKQKVTSDAKKYIVIVDVEKKVEEYIRNIAASEKIEVRKYTQACDYRNSKDTWSQRSKAVEDRLTIYQNALCVVTGRLHVALPSLAMETPILLIKDTPKDGAKMFDTARFDPYYDWINSCTAEEFINQEYEYNILNPVKNPTTYLETRNKLIDTIKSFICECQSINQTAAELNKTPYTLIEKQEWQINLMTETLKKVVAENNQYIVDNSKYIRLGARNATMHAQKGLLISQKNQPIDEKYLEMKEIMSLIKDDYDEIRKGYYIKKIGKFRYAVRKVKKTISKKRK